MSISVQPPTNPNGWNLPQRANITQVPTQFSGGGRDVFWASSQPLRWNEKIMLWLRGLSGKSPEIHQAIKSSNNGNSSGSPLVWLGIAVTASLLVWGAFATHGGTIKRSLEKNKKPNNAPLPTQQSTTAQSSSSSRTNGGLGTRKNPLPQSLASVSIATLFPSGSNPRARTAMQYLFWGDAAGAPIESLTKDDIAQLNKGTFTNKKGMLLPKATTEQFINFKASKVDYTGYIDRDTKKPYIYGFSKQDEPEVTDDSVMAALSFMATKAENTSGTICNKYFDMLSVEYKSGLADRSLPEAKGRRGFGPGTKNAINHQTKATSASNGAMPAIVGYLSALSPSELSELCKNPKPLIEHCKKISQLTHNSSQREEATAAYALLFAHVLNEQKTDEATILKIFADIANSSHISDPKIKNLFKNAHYNPTNYPETLYLSDNDHANGSALDALGLCTWTLKNYWNKKPEDALEQVLNHGKDTDSNAALALALLGATTSHQGKMPQDIERKINQWSWK